VRVGIVGDEYTGETPVPPGAWGGVRSERRGIAFGMETNVGQRSERGAGLRRAQRVGRYLLVGAVLAMGSAWVALALQPWVLRVRPGMRVISEAPLHRAVNRWPLLTAASTLRGDWVLDREALTRRETRIGVIEGLALRLSRTVEYSIPSRTLTSAEAAGMFQAIPGVTVGNVRTTTTVRASYVEWEVVAGFPFPCATRRFASGVVANAPLPNIRFFRLLRWVEEGLSVRWVGGTPLGLPLMPWLPGFVPNMLVWAGVAWGCVRGWRAMRTRRRIKAGACVMCGYAGGGGACPECGE
jgi:hypothetical protein